jgi:hypothetical protein
MKPIAMNRSFFKFLLLFVILLLMLPAAKTQIKSAASPQAPNAQTEHEIVELRKQMIELKDKLSKIEGRLGWAEFLLKDKQDRADEISLNLAEQTYQRLDTDTGFFLVRSVDAVQYLNGYKLRVKFGNPSAASYAGFKLKIRWARAYDFSKYTQETYTEWQNTIQEREISYTDNLEAGAWNPAEIILPATNADQLGFIRLSINTNTVSLRTK